MKFIDDLVGYFNAKKKSLRFKKIVLCFGEINIALQTGPTPSPKDQ